MDFGSGKGRARSDHQTPRALGGTMKEEDFNYAIAGAAQAEYAVTEAA